MSPSISPRSIVIISLIAAAIITECIAAPIFSVAQRPGISRKSRFFKMLGATMFLSVGVLAFLLTDNQSGYARFMLIGLAFSWVGDLFLHIKGMAYFIMGFISFTTAHICYICAYYKASAEYFPERSFITVPEIAAIAVIMVLTALYYILRKKMSFKNPGMIASVVYGFVLVPMVVKAAAFSLDFVSGGYPYSLPAGIMLTLGAVSFFLSDTSLALLMFNKPDKDNYKLKNYNVATYFAGQTLLALTILFIGV